MPSIEIKFDQIAFDLEVQTYCNNPKFKCPHYGHSWCCPPEAPYLENKASQYQKFFLVYYELDINIYIKQIQINHPKRSEEKIRNSIYRNSLIRDGLEKEIDQFITNYKENFNNKLILYDGHCRKCEKEGNECTYDSGEPCRYPDNKRYSMEATGIHVDKTVRNLGFDIEWPPTHYIYRFGLVCFK